MAADTVDTTKDILTIPNCNCLDAWKRCFMDAPPTLNTLRRAFTALLRWAYADVNRFDGYADVAECLTYSTDPKSSKLSINPGSTVDPGDTENVPGILIKMDNGVQFDYVGTDPTSYESRDTSNIRQAMLAQTEITILCRNFDADVCCAMGDICMLFLFSMHSKLFNTWSWLRDYKIKSQTEPKLSQQDGEAVTKWYESTVVISLVYEYNTFVARESKRLKDYTLEAIPDSESPRLTKERR